MEEILDSLRPPTEKQGLATPSKHPLKDPSSTLSRPRSLDYYSNDTRNILPSQHSFPLHNSHPIEILPLSTLSPTIPLRVDNAFIILGLGKMTKEWSGGMKRRAIPIIPPLELGSTKSLGTKRNTGASWPRLPTDSLWQGHLSLNVRRIAWVSKRCPFHDRPTSKIVGQLRSFLPSTPLATLPRVSSRTLARATRPPLLSPGYYYTYLCRPDRGKCEAN